MRHFPRCELEAALSSYLSDLQERIDHGEDAETLWRNQRQRARMRKVAQTLARMTGPCERCMYCEDSRGTDVDHFWPRTAYRDRVFLWLNLLWVCTGCNRVKGSRFPLDSIGKPLLIDPTAEDPWDFLFYDPRTDELAARWDPETGGESLKGRETLRVISTLRYEAVANGRGRTRRNLTRAVRAFLAGAPHHDETTATGELIESIDDNDGYGLTTWFFLRDGADEQPFLELRLSYPAVWKRIAEHLRLAE